MLTQRHLASQRVVDVGRRLRRPWWSTGPAAVMERTGATTVTADTTAHTKGAWVELIASTADDADLLILTVTSATTNTDTATLLDIGVGGAGSETVIVGDVAVGGAYTAVPYLAFAVPVFIAAGSRVAARIQSVVTGGKTATVYVQLAKAGVAGTPRLNTPVAPVTMGTSTATSAGTAMSASANTYVEITAATAAPFGAVVLVPSLTTNAAGSGTPQFTLGAGSAGAEVEIGSTFANYSSNELIYMNSPATLSILPCDLPAGVRLAVKATTSTSVLDVTLIGIPRTAIT